MMTLDRKPDIENLRRFASTWDDMDSVDKHVISIMFQQDKSVEFYCGFLASMSAVFQLLYVDLPQEVVSQEIIQKVIRGSICYVANYIVEREESFS